MPNVSEPRSNNGMGAGVGKATNSTGPIVLQHSNLLESTKACKRLFATTLLRSSMVTVQALLHTFLTGLMHGEVVTWRRSRYPKNGGGTEQFIFLATRTGGTETGKDKNHAEAKLSKLSIAGHLFRRAPLERAQCPEPEQEHVTSDTKRGLTSLLVSREGTVTKAARSRQRQRGLSKVLRRRQTSASLQTRSGVPDSSKKWLKKESG